MPYIHNLSVVLLISFLCFLFMGVLQLCTELAGEQPLVKYKHL